MISAIPEICEATGCIWKGKRKNKLRLSVHQIAMLFSLSYLPMENSIRIGLMHREIPPRI